MENFSFYIETDFQKSDVELKVSSVAVRNGDFILMGKRKDNGRWTLPGGHHDRGEHQDDAAVRELLEETGIRAPCEHMESLGKKTVLCGDGKKRTIFAYQYKTNGPKASVKFDPDQEIAGWEWIDISSGLPKRVSDNQHAKKNVVFEYLGLQKSELTKADIEFLTYDDSLIKARTHKYIDKKKVGDHWVYTYPDDKTDKKHHRYEEEDARKRLIAIANMLYIRQRSDPNTRDESGLNSYDMGTWDRISDGGSLSVSASAKKLRKLLKKYKRQISENPTTLAEEATGTKEYELLGLSDEHPDTEIMPMLHERFKSVIFKMTDPVPRSKWNEYKAVIDKYKVQGLRFDGASKEWYVPKDKISTFDFEGFSKDMGAVNIPVHPLPDLMAVKEEGRRVAEAVATGDLTASQAIEMIQRREIREGYVAVRRKEDGRYEIFSPFNQALVDLFSNRTGQLTGITEYNPTTKARETLDLELVEEAVDKIKSLLPSWKVVTEGVEEAKIARDQLSAELKMPIPKVQEKMNPEFKLFPYQNEAVRFLEKTNGNALIGDEMGLGKTLQSLAYVAANNKKVLVVVPKVVRRTWIQEAERFFPDYFKGNSVELISKNLRTDGMPDLTGVRIASVNYESLEKFLPAIREAGFDTIVVDESHRIKSPRAKITRTLMGIRDLFNHRILLSGTAVKNKKSELYTQTEFIRPGLFTKDELVAGTIGGVWNKLKSTIYLARQKKSVLPDLPEKTTLVAELEVPGMPVFPSSIGEMSAAKVSAAKAKAPITKNFVQEILDSSDSKVLLFSESREAAERLSAELGDVAILHHGQMSDEAREFAKAEFQREGSPKRVFVSTRQSLAVGATLTAADKVVFNDLPWTAADIRQAEDRVHRIGQRNSVNVYWMTAKDNEWDANITDILRRKYELNKKINEGKQLTKEEREWMNKPVSLEEIRAQISGGIAGPVKKSFYILKDAKKNVVFEHLGLQKSDLFKSGVKYLRKYRHGNKWRYIYVDKTGKHRQMHPDAQSHLEELAGLGHRNAKDLIAGAKDITPPNSDLKSTKERTAATIAGIGRGHLGSKIQGKLGSKWLGAEIQSKETGKKFKVVGIDPIRVVELTDLRFIPSIKHLDANKKYRITKKGRNQKKYKHKGYSIVESPNGGFSVWSPGATSAEHSGPIADREAGKKFINKKVKEEKKKLDFLNKFHTPYGIPSASRTSSWIGNYGYIEIDRYRRQDHGSGDGDEWMDDDEIKEDWDQGVAEHGDKLKRFNQALKDAGYKPNASFDLGEKGHFAIVFDPVKKSEEFYLDLLKGGPGSGPHKKNIAGLVKKIKEQRESHQINDPKDKEDHFNASWDTAKNLFPKDKHEEIKAHVREKVSKKSEEFYLDLLKARNVKYKRRFRRNNKWHYIYDEPKKRRTKKEALEISLEESKMGEAKPAETNMMGPPPPENVAFVKPGREVTIKESRRFISHFESDFKQLASLDTNLKRAGATHFASRLKDGTSLWSKMHGRWKDGTLNEVSDAIGARGLASSIKDQQRMLSFVKKEMEIVKVNDSSTKGRPDGYRAIHVIFKTPSGKMGELQLKTHRQQVFSGFTHDAIYKGPKEIKENPEVVRYSRELSDYLYGLDKSDKPEDKTKRPAIPGIMKKRGIEFPWALMDEFGTGVAAELSEKKVKFFAIVRDHKTKENIRVAEFNSFEMARGFRDSYQDKYEVPIGYSKSKEEFFETFSEYRMEDYKVKKSSDTEHLFIRKGGPGSGRHKGSSYSSDEMKRMNDEMKKNKARRKAQNKEYRDMFNRIISEIPDNENYTHGPISSAKGGGWRVTGKQSDSDSVYAHVTSGMTSEEKKKYKVRSMTRLADSRSTTGTIVIRPLPVRKSEFYIDFVKGGPGSGRHKGSSNSGSEKKYTYKVLKTSETNLERGDYNPTRGDHYRSRTRTLYQILRSDGKQFKKYAGSYSSWKKRVKKDGHEIVKYDHLPEGWDYEKSEFYIDLSKGGPGSGKKKKKKTIGEAAKKIFSKMKKDVFGTKKTGWDLLAQHGDSSGRMRSLQGGSLYHRSEKFYLDLFKSRTVKYLRKYKRGNKWIYIYKDSKGKHRPLHSEAVGHLESAAELGHAYATDLIRNARPYNEEKLALLREASDLGHGPAKEKLSSMGIDRNQEKLEERLIPGLFKERLFDTDLGDRKEEAVTAIRRALDLKIFGYLSGHTRSEAYKKLNDAGINLQSVMGEISRRGSIHGMLIELERQMKKVDEAHGGISFANSSANSAGGYGNLGYKAVISNLQNTRDLAHADGPRPALFPMGITGAELGQSSLSGYSETLNAAYEQEAKKTRAAFEAERAAIEAKREKRARLEAAERESYETHKVSVDSMSNYYGRVLDESQKKKMALNIEKFFGSDFKFDRFLQHLQGHKDVEIMVGTGFFDGLLGGSGNLSVEFKFLTPDGSLVKGSGAGRTITKYDDGSIGWKNGVFNRPSNQALSDYPGMATGLYGGVENFLREITKNWEGPAKENTVITIGTAANSGWGDGYKGGLVWAKHKFDWSDPSYKDRWKNRYLTYESKMRSSGLSEAKISAFKDAVNAAEYPYQFANIPIKLTKSEAEAFIGRSLDWDFNQIIKKKGSVGIGDLIIVDSRLSYGAKNYINKTTGRAGHLNDARKRQYEKVLPENRGFTRSVTTHTERDRQQSARTAARQVGVEREARERVRQAGGLSDRERSHVDYWSRVWNRGGRIRMTARRIGTISRRMNPAQLNYFLRINGSAITRQARARILAATNERRT